MGSEGGFTADELHALETLMIAVGDGLAVQKLLDPDAVTRVVLPFWEDVSRLVERTPPHTSRAGGAAGPRGARPYATRGPTPAGAGVAFVRRAPRGWCTQRPGRR